METNKDKLIRVNGLSPAIPIHPGSILGEELKARGIRQKDFASTIGIQASHLSALIHGARSFTPETAVKIESGLKDIPASFWITMQTEYLLDKNKTKRRYSAYVDGYKSHSPQPLPALNDSGAEAGTWKRITVTIPDGDTELFSVFADRMGWIVSD